MGVTFTPTLYGPRKPYFWLVFSKNKAVMMTAQQNNKL